MWGAPFLKVLKMPLIYSDSDEAFKKNVETEIKAGKPRKQALAIAYKIKRDAQKDKRKQKRHFI